MPSFGLSKLIYWRFQKLVPKLSIKTSPVFSFPLNEEIYGPFEKRKKMGKLELVKVAPGPIVRCLWSAGNFLSLRRGDRFGDRFQERQREKTFSFGARNGRESERPENVTQRIISGVLWDFWPTSRAGAINWGKFSSGMGRVLFVLKVLGSQNERWAHCERKRWNLLLKFFALLINVIALAFLKKVWFFLWIKSTGVGKNSKCHLSKSWNLVVHFLRNIYFLESKKVQLCDIVFNVEYWN